MRLLVVAMFCAAFIGCGEKDLNKDLKPVDPNAKLDSAAPISGSNAGASAEGPK